MTEYNAPRRKVVTSTPVVSSSASPSTSSQPRVRAKVDLASIATPTNARPTLRNTPSSVSIRSNASSITPTRALSPTQPPLPAHARISSPGLNTPTGVRSPLTGSQPPRPPSRQHSTPVAPTIRARATPIQRTQSSQTPTHSPLAAKTGSMGPPRISTEPSNGERGRAKVKPLGLSSVNTPPARSRSRSSLRTSPLHQASNTTHSDVGGSSTGYDLERITSHHSSPGKQPFQALPPHMSSAIDHVKQHPTSSCPTSPLPSSQPELPRMPHHKLLPLHPKAAIHGLYPITPGSPEMRTVDLPAMTPRRWSESSDFASGSVSRDERPEAVPGSDMDRWSGSTAVEGLSLKDVDGDLDVEVDEDAIPDDAEEAKINRKIADLEISNASLMALNRSLEVTKAKQRLEILKLRRALRESLDGGFSSKPLPSPLGLLSPTTEEGGFEPDSEEESTDDEEIEERWTKLQDMIANMHRRGEAAVTRGNEEIRIPGQRVLDWTEVDNGGGTGDQSVDEGTTPEG